MPGLAFNLAGLEDLLPPESSGFKCPGSSAVTSAAPPVQGGVQEANPFLTGSGGVSSVAPEHPQGKKREPQQGLRDDVEVPVGATGLGKRQKRVCGLRAERDGQEAATGFEAAAGTCGGVQAQQQQQQQLGCVPAEEPGPPKRRTKATLAANPESAFGAPSWLTSAPAQYTGKALASSPPSPARAARTALGAAEMARPPPSAGLPDAAAGALTGQRVSLKLGPAHLRWLGWLGGPLQPPESPSAGARLGKKFALPLKGAVFLVGRNGKTCDLVLESKECPMMVSRRHAEIRLSGPEEASGALLEGEVKPCHQGEACYKVTDCGSLNGTFLNGTRIAQPAELKHNDVLAFGTEDPNGPFRFQVVLPDQERQV